MSMPTLSARDDTARPSSWQRTGDAAGAAAGKPTADGRRTLLHFIHGTGGGGAESMLVNLAEKLDPGRFRSVVVAVNARAWPQANARLRAAGVTLHDLQASAFLQRGTLSRLRALLRQERPDIMQTWMHHADLVGGWAARLAGVRGVVWGVHCREIHRNPGDGELKTRLFRRALALSSRFIPARVISCSAAAIEDHVALGYPRAKMRWIPNGIDAARFQPDMDAALDTRAELGLPPDAPVIGYVGRFHEMKDLPTFLRAAALLQARVPEAHFVFCGGAEVEMRAEERRLITQLPRRDQTRFSPFRPDPWRLYPALTLFSLSSRTEAFPMTVIEAMACGVPCVTADVGDCARQLQGVGRVVPKQDAEALAAAWEGMIRMGHEARAEAGRASRQRVLEHFTIEEAARQYAAAYEELGEVRR